MCCHNLLKKVTAFLFSFLIGSSISIFSGLNSNKETQLKNIPTANNYSANSFSGSVPTNNCYSKSYVLLISKRAEITAEIDSEKKENGKKYKEIIKLERQLKEINRELEKKRQEIKSPIDTSLEEKGGYKDLLYRQRCY